MTNREIIYNAYLKAYSMIKGKVVDSSEYAQKRTKITKRIDRCLMTCRYSVSEIDKKNAVMIGKNIYREYCSFVIGNPGGKTDQLKNRILEMLDKISEIEEHDINLYNKALQDGYELDLRTVLKKGLYIKELTLISMTDVIKHAIKDKNLGAVVEHVDYYVTPRGRRYHRKDCPYCRNKVLIMLTLQNEDNDKYGPCTCVKKMKPAFNQAEEKKKPSGQDKKRFITAFLDESRRDDPWKAIDKSCTKKQNVMSYVMCEGYLQSEAEIYESNILEEDVYLSPRKGGNLNLSIHETFARIMIKAALMPYVQNLVIYSDNQSACEEWESIAYLELLSKQFNSVTIKYIPREKNKYADRLGRKKDVIVADKGEISELLDVRNKLSMLTDEMTFVKSYFPSPIQMIPNLVEELRLIAEDKQREVSNAS